MEGVLWITLGLIVVGFILSPFIVFLLVKVATFAVLKTKANFRKKEKCNGQEEQEKRISTRERKA